MMPLLTERYADQIRGMLHCFDRILVKGIIDPLSYGRGITAYFYEHKLRIFPARARCLHSWRQRAIPFV